MIDRAKEELTPRDVTFFEDILKKDINSLTPYERELLVARRMYLTEEELAKFEIEGAETAELAVIYGELSFNDLKKAAKEKGIVLSSSLKKDDIIALLNQYDSLTEGDEFQGKTAHIATQEMIDENELSEELAVGDLFFTNEKENK